MALLILSPPPLSFHQFASSKSNTHHSIYNERNIVNLTTITQCKSSVLAAATNPLVEEIVQKQEGLLQHDTKNKIYNSVLAEVVTLCREGQLKEVMEILSSVENQKIPLHSDVYAHVLEACAKYKALAYGTQIHTHMLNSRIKQTPFLWSKLVRMYAYCGSLEDARLVFQEMKEKNVFSWNAMIAGCVRDGLCEDALALYYTMERGGLRPDKYTFPRVLKACGGLRSLQRGKKVHSDIARRGLHSDLFIGNALIDMYAKCGCIQLARQVFDKMPQRDVVSWNTILAESRSCTAHEEVGRSIHL